MVNFINKTLKLEIKQENIEKYNSSFITNDLINQESDVIYKIKNKNIFFLIEHQTNVDYSMAYRILEYENEIIKSAIDYNKLKQKGYKFPLVISIVLYAEKYIKDIQENLEGYEEIQFTRYNIVDVNEISNYELLKDESFLTKAMLIEKVKYKEELVKYLDDIVIKINKNRNFYNDETVEILIIIINLILKKKIVEEKAEELIKCLKGGKEEGKKKMIKAMINENIPIDIIEKVSKLTKKEIENLK